MRPTHLRSSILIVGAVAAVLALASVQSSKANDALPDAGTVTTASPAGAGPAMTSDASQSSLSNATLAEVQRGDTFNGWAASLVSGQVPGTPPTAPSGTPAASPVLAVHPTLGQFAAPITRFRDGGHAYYLDGAGLHACTYVGKCMDLFAPAGEPVYAMADGVVKIPHYMSGGYGHYLIITFRDRTKAIYAHLSTITVAPGPVTAGTALGTVGCSGTSGETNHCKQSEAHLHLEWSGLRWKPGHYGELPPQFDQWRGTPPRCYHGCK
ncbi:MAG: M23 family metallopeptidase [Actinomycetes bacterium]